MKPRLLFLGGAAVLLGLALVFFGGQLLFPPYTFQGSVIDPPIPAADIVLTDQHGAPFRLSAQRGQVILLYFGYTYCPDVCPATLSDLAYVRKQIKENTDHLTFVFITVDPERDTREYLQGYLANFDPAMVGLTGELPELEQVWQDYGVTREKQDTGNSAAYLVDHTARVYVIDPAGNLRLTFPFGMDKETMLRDVMHLLQEN